MKSYLSILALVSVLSLGAGGHSDVHAAQNTSRGSHVTSSLDSNELPISPPSSALNTETTGSIPSLLPGLSPNADSTSHQVKVDSDDISPRQALIIALQSAGIISQDSISSSYEQGVISSVIAHIAFLTQHNGVAPSLQGITREVDHIIKACESQGLHQPSSSLLNAIYSDLNRGVAYAYMENSERLLPIVTALAKAQTNYVKNNSPVVAQAKFNILLIEVQKIATSSQPDMSKITATVDQKITDALTYLNKKKSSVTLENITAALEQPQPQNSIAPQVLKGATISTHQKSSLKILEKKTLVPEFNVKPIYDKDIKSDVKPLETSSVRANKSPRTDDIELPGSAPK